MHKVISLSTIFNGMLVSEHVLHAVMVMRLVIMKSVLYSPIDVIVSRKRLG